MLSKLRNFIADTFVTKTQLSERFVDNYLLPDMVANGFGFGRKAIGEAVKQLKITNFDEALSLTADQMNYIRSAKNVGPKVYTGFLTYLTKRGVLLVSDPDAPPPEAILIDPDQLGKSDAHVLADELDDV